VAAGQDDGWLSLQVTTGKYLAHTSSDTLVIGAGAIGLTRAAGLASSQRAKTQCCAKIEVSHTALG